MFEVNRINIVVAHPAEAKPLCAMLNMLAVAVAAPYRIFGNDEGVSLIVSGMGKLDSASATAYLAGLQAALPACVWLNIGIAGHGTAAIGAGLLAHKITDAATGKSFYPHQLFKSQTTSEIISVDVPEQNYPRDAAYDMEAAGFYASASSVAPMELVHAFKVISDNPQQTLEKFDIAQVDGLITSQRDRLHALLRELNALLGIYRSAYFLPDEYSTLLGKYAFTVSQKAQLKRLCERYHALEFDAELKEFSEKVFGTSRHLLTAMQTHIAQQVKI